MTLAPLAPSVRHPLLAAAPVSVGTLRAALAVVRSMWRLRTARDDQPVVTRKLDRFAHCHGWRTACQLGAFAAMLWAVA